MTRRWLAVLVAAFPIAIAAQSQQPRFQAGTAGVVVDVAVRRNDEPVLGLGIDDFDLVDNGVHQTMDSVSAEAFPLDLTVVIDVSRQTAFRDRAGLHSTIDEFTAAIRQIVPVLGPNDKLRVITFNETVKQVFDGAPVKVDHAIEFLQPNGRTSINDAVMAALVRTRPAGRRALVVAFTAGHDTTGTISPATLRDVAARADTVLDVFVAHNPDPIAMKGENRKEIDYDVLRDAATATGGLMDDLLGDDHVVATLKSSLLDFKSRYVLGYTPKGVETKGRHDITITIKKPGEYKIFARKGYDGGSQRH